MLTYSTSTAEELEQEAQDAVSEPELPINTSEAANEIETREINETENK